MQNSDTFLWEYLKSTTKPLVLLGTGDGADKILSVMEQYGLSPACFTASGDFTIKPDFRGYKVLPFYEVERLYGDFIILLCFGSDKPQVLDWIYSLSKKHELYAPDTPVCGGELFTPEFAEQHKEQLALVREMLADDKSREVFDGWQEYRLTGRIDILEAIATPRSEILELLNLRSDGESGYFIDAGAFKGDTVDEFLAETDKQFKKIIAIEPDRQNYMKLRRKFYAYGSEIFKPVNAVTWDTDTELEFDLRSGRGGCVLQIGVTAQPAKRTIKVNAVTIDSLVGADSNAKPTFLKMDVEGAEAKTLNGAAKTIAVHRPKLLVSLYHKSADMFELPLLIHKLNSEYKYYLRKTHCLPGWEFELIASRTS